MKDRISTLMDGELDDQSAAQAIDAVGRDRDALETWRTYHMISDAMRQSRVLSDGFAARVTQRLAAEPTVLAPRALQAQPRRWFAVPAAASVVAAVGLVGWMALGPQPQVPAPASAPVAQAQPEPRPTLIPLPSAASDYLLAHQGFSPRISFQGMAPYVRTVSEQTVEPRR
jgi:sigma-E factor negative regulatory protein RseA